MAPRKRRPKKVKPPGPTVVNKAPDLLPNDEMAEVMGWMGAGYKAPPGPPWPWDALSVDERALFDKAVARLITVMVPRKVAEVLCWAGGGWHNQCQMIVDAADVQAYPSRKHIRLVPRPPPPRLYLPGGGRVS